MQLYALDADKTILADEAKRGYNYRCLECGSTLRIRGGLHRHLHFYHLERSPTCRQDQKSDTHIQFQIFLRSLLPQGEIILERPFLSIGRIADLFWEKQNLIIEIQCSPISLLEAKARTEAYESLGLRVLWILHDKRFNRKNLSAAEDYLRRKNCYFTNFNPKRPGDIYDQMDFCEGARRPIKSFSFPVDMTSLHLNLSVPEHLQNIFGERTICFKGDCIDRFSKDADHPLLLRFKEWHTKKVKPAFSFSLFYRFLIRNLLKRFS